MNLRILPIAALALALSACASTDNGYRSSNGYYGGTTVDSRVTGNC